LTTQHITLHFLKTGLQTTIQDFGRIGFQHFGVPVSGVMDKVSAKIANKLVGNPPQNPVLEMTLIGAKIEFEGDCQIAITGANISPQINQKPIEMYQTIAVKNADVLSFGKLIEGCRTYLAVGGKWSVKKWLGSYSAATQNPEILTPNSIFKKGDKLKIQGNSSKLKNIKRRFFDKSKVDYIFDKNQAIRILKAPEFDYFTQEEIKVFLNQNYTIANQSNRMGYRLESNEEVFRKKDFSMISSGIIIGTIQITPSGNPIILLSDAQTTGGYPRIAKVIDEDLSILAQRKPMDKVSFIFKKEDHQD